MKATKKGISLKLLTLGLRWAWKRWRAKREKKRAGKRHRYGTNGRRI